MFTEAEFNETAAELARLNNLPLDQAEEFMAQIGDHPMMNDAGRVVVTDAGGKEVALISPFEE